MFFLKKRHAKQHAFFFISLFLAALFVPLAPGISAGEENPYAQALVEKARAMHISEDDYWGALLHYKRTSSGAFSRSLIDDPAFFLAPDGNVDSEAELEATIRSFFSSVQGDKNPRCRFIARYTWLKKKLGIDESRLPPMSCPELEKALESTRPESATLVYADSYMNSPVSMFGHTFLRIDGSSPGSLLSLSVSYAALANDKNALSYAFKGIFGYFPGYFTTEPYYEKVKDYNGSEQRDMWEYHLALTRAEVKRMFLHIWELKDIYSDYFYFTRNCSYNILPVLDTARPSLHLVEKMGRGFKVWVVPTDTLRLIKESGLINGTVYRSSEATRARLLSREMDLGERQTATSLSGGRISTNQFLKTAKRKEMPCAEEIKVLDLAAELIQYKYAVGKMTKGDYLKRFYAVLAARSPLGAEDRRHPATPPDALKGHGTARAGAGIGYRDGLFAEINLRPSYQGLMDPDEGYRKGAQIEFLNTYIRYFFKENRFVIQKMDLINIASISSRSDLFKPVSWNVNTGFERQLSPDGRDLLFFKANGGAGLAHDERFLGLMYFMPEAETLIGGGQRDDFSAGAGLRAGFYKTIWGIWKAHPAARVIFYVLGHTHASAKVSLDQNFTITKDNSIALSISRERAFGFYRNEFELSWNTYF